MKQFDLAALWDRSYNSYNAGFVVVKPTLFSFRVYEMIQYITTSSKITTDQEALKKAIVKLKHEKNGFNVTVLDRNIFMSGHQYFEHNSRLLPRAGDPCCYIDTLNCSVLVVHNNWIVGKEAKIYRFREHFMWLYDGENEYYSSHSQRYVTYRNAMPIANTNLSLLQVKQSTERQISALKTALTIGYLLNRVVILPKFYCNRGAFQCPLNSLIHMKTFDSHFLNLYRESSFLLNPKVPNVVKKNVLNLPLFLYATRVLVSDKISTIGSDNIIRLFQNVKEKVINFDILDRVQVTVINQSIAAIFNNKIQNAFRLSDYRQRKKGELL